MKTGKLYFYLLFTYIMMQVSSLFVIEPFIEYFQKNENLTLQEAKYHGFAWTLFITNCIAALLFLLLLAPNKRFLDVFPGKGKREKSSIGNAVMWGFIGFFLALGGQMLAAMIESALGITAGSENTAMLGDIAKVSPIVIISIVLFAPFLEEIVFRRVIFAGLYNKTNFLIAAVGSALIFAAVHNEFEHILMYLAPGLVFSYLYFRTKRLLAPMISHLLMNGFVTIIQLNFDKIEQMQKMNQALIFFGLQ